MTTEPGEAQLQAHIRSDTSVDLHLTSRRKCALDSERTIRASETLERAMPAAIALGVTRLADITGLDRIGIPVWSAVVPESDDGISVYNGKGVGLAESKAGALMEAIERQAAVKADLPFIEASYGELRAGGMPAADPLNLGERVRSTYSENHPYRWTQAYDLNTGEPVLVPSGLACYGPRALRDGSPFQSNSSNGLASGNCFEEAVCHALCELIERDSATFAELGSYWGPRAHREALLGREAGDSGSDNPDACPRVDLSDAPDPIPELMSKFRSAGLDPVVRDMTSQVGVCSIVASVADDRVAGVPQAHGGQGAHPNAAVAVMRALLEMAQSRAVDIQGVREDIIGADAPATAGPSDLRRVRQIDRRRWQLQQSGAVRRFRDLASVPNDDIANDIRLLLARLRDDGLHRALVVPFPAPAGFSVVRVIVPGLEYWSVNRGRIGQRALEFWKRHVT